MITSFSNPLIKQIKRLRQKKYRERDQLHLAEGVRTVLSAIETGAGMEALVYSPELLRSKLALQALADQEAAGTRCEAISKSLFQSISERDNPAGLAAIVRNRWNAIDDFPVDPDAIFIALLNVAEPGNLGTIFRSADAAGVAGLILVGTVVDPYHPTTLKASMGTLYSMPFAGLDDSGQLFKWAESRGLQTVATTAKSGTHFRQAEYRKPSILIMGSEREGLDNQVLRRASQIVTIPMKGRASSLNLAVATAIILFEMTG